MGEAAKELGFWLVVAIVAVVGPVLFKIIAASPAGDAVPGLRTLAATA